MSEYVLEISNLTKYYGKFKAINNLNLKVKKGTIHGFLGPNGAGKTTTIRTVLNILKPTTGEIKLFGKIISDGKSTELHDNIGYIPGDVSLYGHMTVKQQLDYFASLRPSKPSFRMQEFIQRFQLDVTKHNKGLSKGNRQKVALVQAFMHDPEFFIFDEVTSGLDPLMQQELYKVIEEEAEKGKTFFISSHNLPEIQRLADMVSVIRKGQIAENISINELQKKVVQKVDVTYKDNFDCSSIKFDHPGISIGKRNGKRTTYLITSKINDILRLLSDHPILSIAIPEPSLEDYFMHFYEGMET